MKFIYFLIMLFTLSPYANENETLWRGEIQIFEDLTYANNLSADIKRKYKKLVQSEASLSSYSYRHLYFCLLYTSPSPRDQRGSRMPSSA